MPFYEEKRKLKHFLSLLSFRGEKGKRKEGPH
jgi:hypothetical protein